MLYVLLILRYSHPEKTKFEHQDDIIYRVKCFAENCPYNYIGKSAKRIIGRVKDHGGKGTKSHVLKHSSENKHVEAIQKNFKIIGSHFKNNRLKRKIAKTLLIEQELPTLNIQDKSFKLKLLN